MVCTGIFFACSVSLLPCLHLSEQLCLFFFVPAMNLPRFELVLFAISGIFSKCLLNHRGSERKNRGFARLVFYPYMLRLVKFFLRLKIIPCFQLFFCFCVLQVFLCSVGHPNRSWSTEWIGASSSITVILWALSRGKIPKDTTVRMWNLR